MLDCWLTGFGPFNGNLANPSEEIANNMGEKYEWIKAFVLDVTKEGVEGFIKDALLNPPKSLIMLGLDSGRTDGLPFIEICAKTADLCSIPTNYPIHDWPRWNIMSPFGWSNDAGSYFCNELYCRALQKLAARGTRCLFIHIPQNPNVEQTEALILELFKLTIKS